MSQVCIGPFRIAEGEQEPESCFERDAEGWWVWVNPYGRTYYYRKKGQAENAAAVLQGYGKPKGGRPWWPGRTVYLP